MLKDCFTIEYTRVIKGIAILLVMLHHLFYMNLEVPVDLDTTWWIHIMMFLSKVGVAIFLILSGYGLFKSYQKNITLILYILN